MDTLTEKCPICRDIHTVLANLRDRQRAGVLELSQEDAEAVISNLEKIKKTQHQHRSPTHEASLIEWRATYGPTGKK